MDIGKAKMEKMILMKKLGRNLTRDILLKIFYLKIQLLLYFFRITRKYLEFRCQMERGSINY